MQKNDRIAWPPDRTVKVPLGMEAIRAEGFIELAITNDEVNKFEDRGNALSI